MSVVETHPGEVIFIMKAKLVLVAFGIAALGAFTLSAQDEQTQWDGIYTEAQARRGSQLYAENCAACHGEVMLGGEMAPGLIGGEFTTNWNDLSMGDLFERIQITMPQDNPGSLSSQDNSDVLAYMLQVGQYPTGEAELPTRIEYLRKYKFLAMKPSP